MPPVFGPSIVVEDPLVILRGRRAASRACRRTARRTTPPGRRGIPRSRAARRRRRTAARPSPRESRAPPPRDRRDDDALAGGETVGLDDDGEAELARRDRPRARRRRSSHDAIARGRNAVARHERPSRTPCCTRAAPRRATDRRCGSPRGAKAIDDAAIERQLGTDDGEIDALRARRARAARRDRRRSTATSRGDARHAGIARRARRPSSTAGSRASFQASACSRPPPPTIRTFMTASLDAIVNTLQVDIGRDGCRDLSLTRLSFAA